jgi:hypothetical protein
MGILVFVFLFVAQYPRLTLLIIALVFMGIGAFGGRIYVARDGILKGTVGGAIAFGLCFLALTKYLDDRAEAVEANRTLATNTESRACERAGETGTPLSPPPTTVFIEFDPTLLKPWGGRPALLQPDDRVTLQLPREGVAPTEVRLEFKATREPIPGMSPERFLAGTDLIVRDAGGNVVARRTNFAVSHSSCLGGRDDQGAERFLRRVLSAKRVLYRDDIFPVIAPRISQLDAEIESSNTGEYHKAAAESREWRGSTFSAAPTGDVSSAVTVTERDANGQAVNAYLYHYRHLEGVAPAERIAIEFVEVSCTRIVLDILSDAKAPTPAAKGEEVFGRRSRVSAPIRDSRGCVDK